MYRIHVLCAFVRGEGFFCWEQAPVAACVYELVLNKSGVHVGKNIQVGSDNTNAYF